jgi:hypothetical protein
VEVLETQLNSSLDFGGINTDIAASALRRAAKGGMLSGDQALGVGGLLAGGERLQRTARNTVADTLLAPSVDILANRCAPLYELVVKGVLERPGCR